MGDKTPLVSVIIPVYNVEPYLRQCLDSVINQTYRSLDILIIDDGSTDGCGAICDEYAERDERIRVFHTENRGLSAARNLGLDNANGEYISFIDSDDWIDADLLEKAVGAIGNADILCFSKNEGTYTGFEALCALINGKIGYRSWSKLFRFECFSSMRFPEGRIMEDIATTYRLLHQSRKVICKDIKGYHHLYRKDSLSQTHDIKNIVDYCEAIDEQYKYCEKVFSENLDRMSKHQAEELYISLLQTRAHAIARAWGWRWGTISSDSIDWKRLSRDARTMFPYEVRKHFSWRIRGGLFLARFDNRLSYWVAHKMHVLTRKVPYTNLAL